MEVPHTIGVLLKPPLPPGFPLSSVGKESACNAGGPSSIPGSGRSAGEGISYPLQYSQASWVLVALLVKNPPAIQETWVRSLGWEKPLEKGKATHSSILAWRIPLKSRDITLSTKAYLVKAMGFPVVIYGCESWTIKKAEC